jgi:hypothetical protein
MGSQPAPRKNLDGRDQQTAPNALGVPLTKWAIASVSGIFVCYVALHFGLQLKTEYQKTKQLNRDLAARTIQLDHDKRALARSQDDLTSQSNARVSERQKHLDILHEKGVVLRVPPGINGPAAVITYYRSDGCIRLERDAAAAGPYGISSGQDLWIPDPTRYASSYSAPFHVNGPRESFDFLPSPAASLAFYTARPQPHFSVVAPTAVIQPLGLYSKSDVSEVHILPVQSGCLDPHPWPFESKWGTAQGCVVQFWRTWKDGCRHYQLYNTCTGKWDKQIYWTQCSKQHHP